MSKAKSRLQVARRTQIESLEDRLAMSADPLGGLLSHHGMMDGRANELQQHTVPVQPPAISHHGLISEDPLFGGISHHTERQADFWLDPISSTVGANTGSSGEVEQNLTSAHEQTGLNDVRANYGFRGGGQTVVVIDSGIAYDHYALGGGFGSNYRVVGGWDFTNENDGDPYDDGPEGAHGTHVAGIIGSSHETHTGVAPDVDLVGLRVFDDDGNGYFSWVENALDWVHDNRDAFENPITAINLSLGTNWNASSIPLWANLESEFAQLEADGIFISVSAGNSFSSYNEPGLSYPAASPYVVPVMSTDDSGYLSHFSQRLDRAIAAPGRFIYSTIPDYAGNNNGVTDDFANFSGTSMAAPYVAGASVIVREAMEFVGYTDITQDMIYDHMRATADTVHDSATDLDYLRLNLGAAIDALMPTDDYGSDEASAYDLGTVSAGLSTAAAGTMNGVISTLDDSDYFTFTAGSTGTVTFATSNTTHQLSSSWVGMGGEGWSGEGGQSYTMSVVAGQQYTVALSSTGGLGYYDLDVSAESTFSYTDWDAVAGQETREGLTAGAATWYRLEAGQYGYLTVEALYDSGTVNLELYDAEFNLIDAGAGGRVDYLAQATEAVFLRVEGDDSNVDFRMTNLVSLAGSTVTVDGTSGDDAFSFAAGNEEHTVSLNGVEYTFDAEEQSTFSYFGNGGEDAIEIIGSAGNETATISASSTQLVAAGYSVASNGVSNVTIESGGGHDTATLYDTEGDETFISRSDYGRLIGNDFDLTARNFADLDVYSSGGLDIAYFYDSAGNDVFAARPEYALMTGDGYHNTARNFDQTRAYATAGGSDKAYLYDGLGNDDFAGSADYARMLGDGYYNYARDFEMVYAYGTSGGTDAATFYDSAGNDDFVATSLYSRMFGAGFYNYARGFENVTAHATAGGHDQATFNDSAGIDTFIARPEYGRMMGVGFDNWARGFDVVDAYATAGGSDVAYLYDSTGDDLFAARPEYGRLSGLGFSNTANEFGRVYAYATGGGNDRAYMYDSAGDDNYVAHPEYGRIYGAGFYNYARGFDLLYAYATQGGDDTANFYDSAGDDQYVATPDYARIMGVGFYSYTRGFDRTRAYAQLGGDDQATLRAFDSETDTYVRGYAFASLVGSNFDNYVEGFEEIEAIDSEGAPMPETAVDAAFSS